MSNNVIRSQVISCAIGSITFTEIMYFAYRAVGSGPGGDLVSPRTVANTATPVAVTPHHVWYELELCVDADEAAALYATDYVTVPGTVIPAVTVTEKATDGRTRTITFSNVYVKSMQPTKVENEAEHQPFTITFIGLAEPSFGQWQA